MKKYELAMRITTQAGADAYFEELVADSMAHGLDRQEAEICERVNLGYWAGYYRSEIRMRVEELFRCEHPVLGKAKDYDWTPDELLGIGFTLGRLIGEDPPEHKKHARG
jgi:hypothetical protein